MPTNLKRFQCERPREKRAVLREQKEALCSPVNKVDRIEQGSLISGLRARFGPRRPNNCPADKRQNAEEIIYYNFFKIHLSVLTVILLYLLLMKDWF